MCKWMRRGCANRRSCLLALLMTLAPAFRTAAAQTIDDGLLVPRHDLLVGNLYTHDAWSRYWEGGLNRTNGNVGTVTTNSTTLMANYGLTRRLNVLGIVPYVWTHASSGVLRGQSGWQDLTLAAKYDLVQGSIGNAGVVRMFGVAFGSVPLTNYTPDLLPLSVGYHSRTIGGRGTLNLQGRRGVYVNASAAYTVRGNVRLDRSVYYTDNQLFLSNEVAMPNLFNDDFAVGYRRRDLLLVGQYSQQQSRGGGDVRRQDLPFVSDRVNFSKAGLTAQVPVPRLRGTVAKFTYTNTFAGRNVGESNTLATGLMYTFHSEGPATR